MATITGTSGNDTLTGGNGSNTINGAAGDDTITAGNSGDIIDGGSGSDTMIGGNSKDTFHETINENYLSFDYINGANGKDTLILHGTAHQFQLLSQAITDWKTSNKSQLFHFGNYADGILNLDIINVENIQLITVPNSAPIAQSDIASVSESHLPNTSIDLIGNVLTNDRDPDAGDVITVTTVTPMVGNYGTLIIQSNGSYSYSFNNTTSEKLAEGVEVHDVFTYSISDGQGGTATTSIDIVITGTNDAPVAQGNSFAINEDSSLNKQVVATDVDDGASLTYSIVGATPAGLTFNPDGTFNFDASNAAYQHLAQGVQQEVTFQYKANDGMADSNTASITITITGVNDAPVAQGNSFAVNEDVILLNKQVVATDVDDGASLTYAIVGATPAGLTFNPDGTFNFDASNAAYQHLAQGVQQEVTFQYKANDGMADSNTASITITITGVNDAPVAQGNSFAVNEDVILLNKQVVATDVDDGASLTYAIVGATPAGLTFNPNGTFNFDASNAAYQHLAQGVQQDVIFQYKANDGMANSNTATVTITITGVNDAPVAQNNSFAVIEDASLLNKQVVATDVDFGASLTYSIVGATPAGLTFNPDGTFNFDASNSVYQHLAQGVQQDVTFQYKANDGMANSNTATVTITITGVNDAPVAPSYSYVVNEDASLLNKQVVASDVDEVASLTYSIVGATPAGLTFNPDGTFNFDASNSVYQHLAQGVQQDVTFQYKANDGMANSNTATVTITITGVNDAPVAPSYSYVVNEDASLLNKQVVASDVDEVASLTYSIVGATPAGLTFNPDGTFNFDASNSVYQHLAQGVQQDVTFQYKANDVMVNSNTATVTITITGVNDAPVAPSYSYGVNEDASLLNKQVVATDVDDGASLTYGIVGATPAGLTFNPNGTFSFNASNAAYQHLAQGVKQDVIFQYKANDAMANSNTATVTIKVSGVNDAPVAANYSFAVNEDVTLLNKQVVATDVDDAASLTYAIVGATPAGLSFNPNGTFSFNAGNAAYQHMAEGAQQGVTFQYKANDGMANSNTATVTITITGVNDAPVSENLNISVNEDMVISNQVVATDIDTGDPLSYILVGSAPTGLNFESDGTFTFEANDEVYQSLATGTYQDVSFQFKANDGSLDSSISTVTIRVNGTNDAPISQDGNFAVDEGNVLNDNVSATDVDAGSMLTYSLVGSTPTGLTFNSDGTFLFDGSNPAYQGLSAGAQQDVTFEYKANDGLIDSDIATVTITVNGVTNNHAPVAKSTSFFVNENANLINHVTATDADADTLTYSLVGAPLQGLIFNANGTFILSTHGSNYQSLGVYDSIEFTFQYKANDGLADSNSATVSIMVRGVNDAPIAQNASFTLDENSILHSQVTATDVDLNLDYDEELTYSLVGSTPAGLTFNSDGTFSLDTNDIAYQFIAAGDSKNYTFQYRANDDFANSNTATVTYTVKGKNDAPIAQNASFSAYDGSLLSNHVTATDVDLGTTLTYSIVGPVLAGLILNSNGTFSYNSSSAFNPLSVNSYQDYSFQYKANDGLIDSNTATATFRVINVDLCITADGTDFSNKTYTYYPELLQPGMEFCIEALNGGRVGGINGPGNVFTFNGTTGFVDGSHTHGNLLDFNLTVEANSRIAAYGTVGAGHGNTFHFESNTINASGQVYGNIENVNMSVTGVNSYMFSDSFAFDGNTVHAGGLSTVYGNIGTFNWSAVDGGTIGQFDTNNLTFGGNTITAGQSSSLFGNIGTMSLTSGSATQTHSTKLNSTNFSFESNTIEGGGTLVGNIGTLDFSIDGGFAGAQMSNNHITFGGDIIRHTSVSATSNSVLIGDLNTFLFSSDHGGIAQNNSITFGHDTLYGSTVSQLGGFGDTMYGDVKNIFDLVYGNNYTSNTNLHGFTEDSSNTLIMGGNTLVANAGNNVMFGLGGNDIGVTYYGSITQGYIPILAALAEAEGYHNFHLGIGDAGNGLYDVFAYWKFIPNNAIVSANTFVFDLNPGAMKVNGIIDFDPNQDILQFHGVPQTFGSSAAQEIQNVDAMITSISGGGGLYTSFMGGPSPASMQFPGVVVTFSNGGQLLFGDVVYTGQTSIGQLVDNITQIHATLL